MHQSVAFLAGALVVIGAVLILSAVLGITYLGLAPQVEAALAIILLVFAGIVVWLFYEGLRAQYRKVKTGKEALIGARGVVTTALEPKGEIRVSGEFWQAKTKGVTIPVGVEVEVVSLEGMFLVVKPAQQKA